MTETIHKIIANNVKRLAENNKNNREVKTNLIKVRKQNCPSCGILLNAASDFYGKFSPQPGDITICANCRTILAFEEAMDLRMATAEEINLVKQDLDKISEKLEQKRYTILATPNGPAILCHQCGISSSNLNDIKHRYCGNCHQFLDNREQ